MQASASRPSAGVGSGSHLAAEHFYRNLAGIKARSINLGWNFGISKVEGVDAVIETTANELVDA